MNAPAGTAAIAPEPLATAQPLVAEDKELRASVTATCSTEHT